MATEATKIPFVEAAAPSTPAASRVVIYAKSDGLMYSKDDAGAETLMSGGAGGGSVATDAIWDAKGDLAGGTGANTAQKLTVGSNDLLLMAASGETTGLKWSAPLAHGARVVRASTDFSVGNNTYTAVEFDGTDTYDTDAFHDPSSNNTRLVIPTVAGVTTGLWTIKASGYSNQTSGRTDCQFRKNAAGNPASGTALGSFLPPVSAALGAYMLVLDAVLSAGDYVECFVRTSAGSGNVVYDAQNSPLFSIAFLGKVT